MSDNYNNSSNNNNNNNAPDKVGKILFAAAIATFVIMGLGIATSNGIIILIGAIIIIATVVFGAAAANMDQKLKKAIRPDMNRYYKYMPFLNDERTKQHPEVQRLLQYTEVQRAFFDPNSLASPTTGNDEHVQELLRLFDEMQGQAADGTAYAPGDFTLPPDQAQQRKEIEQQEKKKNTPRRITGTIMMIVGLVMFVMPFFVVLTMGSGSVPPEKAKLIMGFFFAAPFGMILVKIGSSVRK